MALAILIPSPEYIHYHTNVHIGAIDPGIRSPDSLNAESGAIDPGIRSPDSLNAESGSGGVSRGLGVTLSATIRSFSPGSLYMYVCMHACSA